MMSTRVPSQQSGTDTREALIRDALGVLRDRGWHVAPVKEVREALEIAFATRPPQDTGGGETRKCTWCGHTHDPEDGRCDAHAHVGIGRCPCPGDCATVSSPTGDREPPAAVDKQTRTALFDAQAALMQAIIDTPAGPGRERAERASRRLSDFIAKRRILTDLLDAVDAAPSSGDREREALSVRDMIALALYIDHDTIVDHDALSDAFDGHSCPHLYDAGLLFVQQIPSGEYVDSITDAGLRAFADAYARLDSPPSPSPTGGEAAGAPQAIDAEAVIDLLAFVVASHGRGDDHPDDYEEQARCRCGWEGQWRKDGQASADARRHVVEQHLPPAPSDGREAREWTLRPTGDASTVPGMFFPVDAKGEHRIGRGELVRVREVLSETDTPTAGEYGRNFREAIADIKKLPPSERSAMSNRRDTPTTETTR